MGRALPSGRPPKTAPEADLEPSPVVAIELSSKAKLSKKGRRLPPGPVPKGLSAAKYTVPDDDDAATAGDAQAAAAPPPAKAPPPEKAPPPPAAPPSAAVAAAEAGEEEKARKHKHKHKARAEEAAAAGAAAAASHPKPKPELWRGARGGALPDAAHRRFQAHDRADAPPERHSLVQERLDKEAALPEQGKAAREHHPHAMTRDKRFDNLAETRRGGVSQDGKDVEEDGADDADTDGAGGEAAEPPNEEDVAAELQRRELLRAESKRSSSPPPEAPATPAEALPKREPTDEVRVELQILSCKGLRNADMFGKSDPFCTVKVNDYQIGKTKVKDDTLNPRWEKAQFNVQVPLRRNKEPSDEHPDRKVRGEKKLKVEITVWDWDLIGDNDFLGRVVLTERHLLRKDGIQEIELGPDPGKPETMLQFKGSIRVRCTVFGSVVLQVLEAEGVAQMDTFGASDPYCILRWQGWNVRKVGKTKRRSNTRRPIWNEEWSLEVPIRRTGSRLHVEMLDYDMIGADDTMGYVALEMEDLRKACTDGERTEYPLLDEKRAKKKVAKGTLTLRACASPLMARLWEEVNVERRGPRQTANTLGEIDVEISVLWAKDLANTDLLSKADPYCVLYQGVVGSHKKAKKVGRTKTIDNTLNPKWENETFRLENIPTVRGGSDGKQKKPEVTIEVWDKDAFNDDFLGCATLEFEDMLRPGVQTIDLEYEDGPIKRQGTCAPCIGCACCLIKWVPCFRILACFCRCLPCCISCPVAAKGQLCVRVRHLARVELNINEAWGLRDADMGSKPGSDPYCIVKHRGKKVAKTKTKSDTCDPKWYETVTVHIPIDILKENLDVPCEEDVVIEVWDKDFFTADDFLGQCVVSHHAMLRPHWGDEFPLVGRPGKKGDDLLATGFLDLHCSASTVPRQLEKHLARLSSDQSIFRELLPAHDKVTKRVYYYDTNTGETFWNPPTLQEGIDPVTLCKYWYDPITLEQFWIEPKPKARPPLESEGFENASAETGTEMNVIAGRLASDAGELDEVEVEIDVLQALGLKNADAGFFGGVSDPYCTLALNGKKVGRTRTKNNTLSPRWNHTFRIVIPLDETTIQVLLEVYDSDMGKDDLLGRAILGRDELLHCGGIVRHRLWGLPGQEQCQGTLDVRCNVHGVVMVHVLGAKGLRGADLLGKSDPYCTALWRGWHAHKLGSTPTRLMTLAPSWDHTFKVPVPLRKPPNCELALKVYDHDVVGYDDLLGRVEIPLSTLTVEHDEVLELKLLPKEADVAKAAAAAEAAAASPAKAKAKSPAKAAGIFGSAKKKDKDVAAEAAAAARKADLGRVLVATDMSEALEELCAKQRAAADDALTANTVDGCDVVVQVVSCNGLRNADFMGKSDPFCKIVYEADGKATEIGKTKTIDETLDPVWENEIFTAENVPTKILEGGEKPNASVTVSVFDADVFASDFLGSVKLEWETLMTPGVHVWKLQTDTTQSKKRAKGSMTVKIEYKARVELRLMEAIGLRDADTILGPGHGNKDGTGSSDPYCVVKYCGKKVGKTKVLKNKLNPKWYETFDIAVPVGGAVEEKEDEMLTIEVWEYDLIGSDDFLGQVKVRRAALLHPHNETQHWKLTARGGKHKDKHVQGYLDMHVHASFIPKILEPKRHGGAHVEYSKAQDPRTGRAYYYDPATQKTFWRNPNESKGKKKKASANPAAKAAAEKAARDAQQAPGYAG